MSTMAINKTQKIHPKKFALWLGLGTIVMMFAGLTSAFIVRRGAGNWVEFELPPMFLISTLLIALSSFTLILAQRSFSALNLTTYKKMLGLTLLLGIGFMITQYSAWLQLTGYGILLQGNPSGSFVYVISGLHAAHVLGGIVFLAIFYLATFRKLDPVAALLQEVNTERTLPIEMLATYWHFVGILWVYLLVFFYYFR